MGGLLEGWRFMKRLDLYLAYFQYRLYVEH